MFSFPKPIVRQPLTCNNCHLDTREGTQPVSDEFYLGVAADGKIKPFIKMEATYNDESHMGYGEWFSHTVTDDAKDCTFCHENSEVLCEGCEGQMLGEGGSFIPQDTIDKVLAVKIPEAAAAATPAATPTPPGFADICCSRNLSGCMSCKEETLVKQW